MANLSKHLKRAIFSSLGMERFVDYYRTLGVQPNATSADIERVYHALIGSSQRTGHQVAALDEAYNTLGDPIKRKRYNDVHYRYRDLEETLRKNGIIRSEPVVSKHPQSPRTPQKRARGVSRMTKTLMSLGSIITGALLAIPAGLAIRTQIIAGCTDTTPQAQTVGAVSYQFTESHYQDVLRTVAAQKGIDFCLAKAIYETEYTGSPFYVSETGAVGVMELMPREGSYTTANYDNYQAARKSKGRMHEGKSAEQWAAAYHNDLAIMANGYLKTNDYEGLFAKDSRFNPEWNIPEGVRELAEDYNHFEAKGHLAHDATLLAMAAYNGGIPAVEKGGDHIPTTTQEYVNYAFERFEICQK